MKKAFEIDVHGKGVFEEEKVAALKDGDNRWRKEGEKARDLLTSVVAYSTSRPGNLQKKKNTTAGCILINKKDPRGEGPRNKKAKKDQTGGITPSLRVCGV